jgi:hypothetical protein
MRSLALFFLLLSPGAHAGDFCQADDLVLDAETTWDFQAGFASNFALATHRQGELFPAKTVLRLASGAGAAVLDGSFDFPAPPNEVGLAYNLYRLTIQIGSDDEPDRQIIDQDYTAGCTGAGASLFPGGTLKLKPLKITPHSDGSPRGVETVHLRFWGK